MRHIGACFLEFDAEKGGAAVFEGQMMDFKVQFLRRYRSVFADKDLEKQFARVVQAAIEETKEKICFEKFQMVVEWQCMFIQDIYKCFSLRSQQL